ncbi:MAG: hypothetical protein DHS20C14_15740 [Phycisphaeraceae bacterium]|nr:MAG: hypothetical protein DHS20C14_15740 [Phycisphaeraceae bacterium]
MSDPLLLWGIALIGAALMLIAIEVFVPSGGLIAVVSGLAAIAGVVCMWRVSTIWGLAGSLTVVVLGPAIFFYMLNILPSTPAGRMLMGGASDEDLAQSELAIRRARDERASLVGAEGVALTAMRPIGKVEIDGNRYEALAETSAIDQGARVRVTSATMHELKVRPVA